MNMKKNLSKLERVPLREAWKHEANDFTPWLAETDNLNTLSDTLGLSELSLVAIEHWVGDFKLDILCTDGEDNVIIENQLDKTNHSHLGQILAYAAGVGAKKVIWIAESFRPEHAAAFQFLNDNTTDDLSFFAVEVELWRIGDSSLAPKFEVVVKPGTGEKRITATGRLINNSSKIFFIVTGKEKAKIVSEIVEKKSGSERYPASRVDPDSGHTVWMLDAPAASLLKT